ncbi:helix-turn-helix transcriptional regulator [Streptomyces sp. CC208A]|uniref:helix-turn-helix domain-containing protein n=1 Tax=Streptomyces sp. CC208A TaxID=3044573 RepID=UPI0024A9A5EF|nr:helix-turn-helix transcriptional regulator [Streptomyces sp. CC208A]
MPPRRVVTGRSQEPRKRFAEELKKLRLERKLSYRALGAALGWDATLFSKMEKGETIGGPEVVQALDTYYGLPGLLLVLWELAAGDQSQFRAKYRQYFELEAEAASIWNHAAGVFPGLLQSRAYARTLMGTGTYEGDELTRHVEARIGRQELLTGPNALGFRTILPEAVLRRPLPDQAQWQEQLEHLLTMGDRRNVTIQVVPHSAGLYALNGTDVTFLRLADGRVVAWVETSFSGTLIEGTADVDLLQLRYDRARDLALSPADSRKFIMRALEEAQCEPSI